MKPRLSKLAGLLLATALAAGCAQTPKSRQASSTPPVLTPAQTERIAPTPANSIAKVTPPEEPKPRSEPLPSQSLTGQILYQTLLGEIAAERGDTALTLRAYQELSRTTRDPRIVRRAAELALSMREPQFALESAKLWVEIDPESPAARQMLAGILMGLNRLDEAQPHIASLLAQEGNALPGALLRLSRIFGRNADKDAARKAIDALTEPYLKYPEAHFARSEAAAAAGDLSGALRAIDAALALRTDWEFGVLQKAQLLRDTDPKRATQLLHDFLKAHPDARDTRLNYARALASDRRYGESRTEFETLRKAYPDNTDMIFAIAVLSLQMGELDRATQDFTELLNKGYNQPNQVRLYLGQISEERKRADDALGWYQAITPGEHYVPAQVRIAVVLAGQGKLDDARQSLKNATASTPRERLALLLAETQLLRDAGRAQEALDLLEEARAKDPEEPDLLYETALMAEKVGRVELSETYLRKLIAKKPDHAHALNALGYSLADRNEKLDEAQTLITDALKLAPEDPFILDSMGWVLFRRGDTAGALDYLKRAYDLRADPEIAAHLGEVLWVRGEREAATQLWRQAVSANPGNEPLNETIKRFIP